MPAEVFVLKEAIVGWTFQQAIAGEAWRSCRERVTPDNADAQTVLHVANLATDGRWICRNCAKVYPPAGKPAEPCGSCALSDACPGPKGQGRCCWESR